MTDANERARAITTWFVGSLHHGSSVDAEDVDALEARIAAALAVEREKALEEVIEGVTDMWKPGKTRVIALCRALIGAGGEGK